MDTSRLLQMTRTRLLGSGRAEARRLLLVIAGAGVLVCLAFRRDRRLWELEE